MLSDELYNPFGPQLCAERREARLPVKRLNDTGTIKWRSVNGS
jgi:hypothetical protein